MGATNIGLDGSTGGSLPLDSRRDVPLSLVLGAVYLVRPVSVLGNHISAYYLYLTVCSLMTTLTTTVWREPRPKSLHTMSAAMCAAASCHR